MTRPTARSLAATALGGALLASLALPLTAASADAATSVACQGGGFSVTLPNGKTVTGDTKVEAKDLPAHSRITIRGKYVEFVVDTSDLGTYDYTLTGAANPADITGGTRTPVFASKTVDLGSSTLGGQLDIKNSKGDLSLLRKGGEVKMKIQAKDCAQGGIFQMEPEAGHPVTMTHVLAPGMFYFVNPYTGKVNFGNGGAGSASTFRGKDSAQVATKLTQTETTTTWSVASGGRLGGVLGEDAVELSAGPTNCVQDCQAQNRVRGSLPVTDPAFSG